MNPSDHERSELDAADDAALNEYLRRDSAVSQRYRELDAPEVPASLDRAVLSQARAAVADKKISRWRGITRWSAPLALAASMVLVVSILLQPSTRREIDKTMSTPVQRMRNMAPEEPAATATVSDAAAAKQERSDVVAPVLMAPSHPMQEANRPAEQPVALAVAEAEKSKQRDSSQEQIAERQRQMLPAPTTSIRPAATIAQRPASAAAPAPAPVVDEYAAVIEEMRARSKRNEGDLSEVTVTGTLRRPEPGGGAGPRGSVRPTTGDEPLFDKNDPQSWLTYIRDLRETGKAASADTQWRRFRQSYPDFTVEANDPARPPRR